MADLPRALAAGRLRELGAVLASSGVRCVTLDAAACRIGADAIAEVDLLRRHLRAILEGPTDFCPHLATGCGYCDARVFLDRLTQQEAASGASVEAGREVRAHA